MALKESQSAWKKNLTFQSWLLPSTVSGILVLAMSQMAPLFASQPVQPVYDREISSYYEPVLERVNWKGGLADRPIVEIETRGWRHSLRLNISIRPKEARVRAADLNPRYQLEDHKQRLKAGVENCLKSSDLKNRLAKIGDRFEKERLLPPDEESQWRGDFEQCLFNYQIQGWRIDVSLIDRTRWTDWRPR